MWTPATGNALHGLQLKILIRALELIKVGGIVCYSTCSLNPVEDEAVVSAALRKLNNKNKDGDGTSEDDDEESPAVELVEWPTSLLPKFQRQAGVSDWKIATYEQGHTDDNAGDDSEDDKGDDFGKLKYYASYEDARGGGMEQAERTMWANKNDVEGMRLELCSRLLPQAQDTGGFFVALLRRNR